MIYGEADPTISNQDRQTRDLELNRVNDFQDTLKLGGGLQTIGVELDFEELTPVKLARDQFFTYEYDGLPGLYLEPQFSSLSDADSVSFSPRIARGGKNSMHGVFFGDLRFDDSYLPVAVKPHETGNAAESALQDHLNGRAISNLGLYSLQTVGVMLGGGDKAYSFTVLEETLTTLDSIDWSQFYPETDQHPGMVNIWSQIARQLGFLHSLGSISHGDLAGRNIATTADNYAFPIDWEKAHISLTTPRDGEVRYAFSHPDIVMLIETFCRPPDDGFKSGLGIFYGKNGDWWEGFQELFLDEYLDIRTGYAQASSDKIAKAEIESELEVLFGSLRLDMKMAQDYCETRYFASNT